MLNGYFGNTGSGKSYSIVEYVIIPSLKEDRHIVTNIPLFSDLLTSIYGGTITQLPHDWYDDEGFADSIPLGAVLILDECWRKWPSGTNIKSVPVNELALLKEHRHRVDSKGRAMRVVLASQFSSDLASWTRKLIQTSYFMQKLDALGADDVFHVDVVRGCPTGENIPKKLIIQTRKGTYKPDIYQFYKSATNSDTGTVGDETVADKRGNLWTSKFLWFCIIFGVSSLIFGPWYVLNSLYAMGGSQPEPVMQSSIVNPPPPEVIPEPVISAAPVEVAIVNPSPSEPVISKYWRVAAYTSVRPGAESVNPRVLLASINNERRFIDFDDNCHFFPGDVDVYCDLDGERVTPWSARPNVNAVLTGLGGAVTAGAGTERREATAPADAAHNVRPMTTVNVVPDTSRAPRTLMSER